MIEELVGTDTFLMASTGAMHAEEFIEGRTAYIRKISDKLSKSTLLPTATEERLFEEALRHVIHVFSSKEYAPAEVEDLSVFLVGIEEFSKMFCTNELIGTFSCDLSARSKTRDRKQCLKNILDQLCWLERKRLYDPPADNEIGHYLLIKKYTRCILAFNVGASHALWGTHSWIFGSVSLFLTLQHALELMELNPHLADLSEYLLEVDIEDVSILTPLMGTKERCEIAPIIRGRDEKSYIFYKHKFKLASKDLRCSEFAFCPPLEDEERSYVQVLDAISSPLIGAEDEMNVYSEDLFNLYLESIYQDTVDIESHFLKIKGWILKNLSLVDWWETGEKHFTEQIYEYKSEYEDHERVAFRKELTEECKVSNGDLPDYISQVDHCLTIVLLVESLVRSTTGNLTFDGISAFKKWKEAGWEAVHALTLLKHGCLVGSVLQEQPILRSPLKHVPLENHQATRKHEHILHEKSQDENVVILEGIIDDLRHIGDSDIVLDKEERALVHNIWGSVASSMHFFVSAMAYEQRRYIIQHYDLIDLSMLGLPAAKTEVTVHMWTVIMKLMDVRFDITNFAQILEAYKIGLDEKFRSL